jgi:Acetyltransferase (GNAT) domain
MSKITLKEATDNQLNKWDDFIESSRNGTLFHMRHFLAYHGDRFAGREHYLVFLRGEAEVASLSLAVDEEDGVRVARSPYGASYGGIVLFREPVYSLSADIIASLVKWLIENRIEYCRFTHPIACCSAISMDTFTLALQEAGFALINRDISSVVRLGLKNTVWDRVSGNARNMVRKAERNGIVIDHDPLFADYWQVMEQTFTKHGTNATHNREELSDLIRRFPKHISIHVARMKGRPVAGVCEFVINSRVNSSFYFCQDPDHQEVQGLSLLVMDALQRSEKAGYNYYDFGTSSVNMQSRPNIFHFKESFGAEGFWRETLEWKMR